MTGDGNVHISAERSPVSTVLLGFTLLVTLQSSMACDVLFSCYPSVELVLCFKELH